MGRRDIPQYTPKHFHKEMSYSPFSCGRRTRLDGSVRFINLSQFSLSREKDLSYVLSEIVKQVEAYDDCRSVPHSREEGAGHRDRMGILLPIGSSFESRLKLAI